MRNFLLKAVGGFGLLLLSSTTAAAQYPSRSEYRYEERAHRGNVLLDRLREDLNRADTSFRGDHWRVATAREALDRFQSEWNSGNYDRVQRDRVIASVQRVAERNRLPGDFRRVLYADLRQVRDFPAHSSWR